MWRKSIILLAPFVPLSCALILIPCFTTYFGLILAMHVSIDSPPIGITLIGFVVGLVLNSFVIAMFAQAFVVWRDTFCQHPSDCAMTEHRPQMLFSVIAGAIIGFLVGVVLEFVNGFLTFMLPPFILIAPLCVLLGTGSGAAIWLSQSDKDRCNV